MEYPSFTTRFLRFLNGLITLTVMVLVGLLAVNLLDVTDFERAAARVKANVMYPRYFVVAGAFLILFLNVYNLVSFIGASPHETHLRSKTEDGEVSIAVDAVENTLERAVEALGDIKETDVNVMKDSAEIESPIHVRATVTTHEKTKFKDVVQHVRSILKQRWNEIIEMDEAPYIEIVLADVSEDTPNNQALLGEGSKSDQAESDEDPYLSDKFSGPKYPVDEDDVEMK